jgi:hypothetical protein
VPRFATGGAAEGGFARGGGLEDAAAALRLAVVGRGFARCGAVGAIGQGFRGLWTREAAGLVDLPSWPMAREIAERVLVAANVAPDEGGAAGPCRRGVTLNQARHDLPRHLERGAHERVT